MTIDDEDRPTNSDGVSRTGNTKRTPRVSTRHAVIAAVGMAAVLGAGVYAATTIHDDMQDAEVAGENAVRATGNPDAAPEGVASRMTTSTSDSIDKTFSPTPSASAPSRKTAPSMAPEKATEVEREIRAAREAAAKAGHPVQRAPQPTGFTVAQDKIHVWMVKTSDGTIRVTTAKADLTGQEDHLIAADNGKAVGHSRCTRQFRFANGAQVKHIPRLLLCWRTSPDRSVLTLASSRSGAPAEKDSAAVIDKEWVKLG